MSKDTSELIEALKNSEEFEKFYKENGDDIKNGSVSDYLNSLIKEKNLDKKEIIKKSEISDIYCYQIFNGTRNHPQKEKLICLAVAMGLDLDETQKLLRFAGCSQLYVKNPADCVVIYGICNKLSIMEINLLLFKHDLKIIN